MTNKDTSTLLDLCTDNSLMGTMKIAIEYLPKPFIVRLGCRHCEWRYSKKCPHSQVTGTSQVLNNLPSEGICLDRLQWLLCLLPKYDVIPSEDRVYRDLTLNLGTTRNLKEFNMLTEYQSLHDAELRKINPDLKLLKHYDKMIDKLWTKWSQVMDKLNKSREKELDRQVPKKHEHIHTKMDLSTLQKIIRGDFTDIDIDAKVIKEDLESDNND